MIQSGKFDSSNMNIKKLTNSLIIFIVKRLIEICGIFVSIFGILLFLSFISYSPDDPNFIFPKDSEIKNLLSTKFDREVLVQLLGVDRVDIDEILRNCNFSDTFIQQANDLQIMEAINECYDEYRLLEF